MNDHKLVEFEGKSYRVGRYTAKVGSAICCQLTPKLLPYLRSGFDLSGVAAILPTIDEQTLGTFIDHSMAITAKIQENGAVTPVFVKPDKWIDKELEFNGPAVMALTVHALAFNLAPFFTGGGLQKIIQSVTDSNQ